MNKTSYNRNKLLMYLDSNHYKDWVNEQINNSGKDTFEEICFSNIQYCKNNRKKLYNKLVHYLGELEQNNTGNNIRLKNCEELSYFWSLLYVRKIFHRRQGKSKK